MKPTQCDYCGEYDVKVKSTPYMADAEHKKMMCKKCWRVTQETAEVYIGEF